jgi:hypothetical protein
VDQKYLRVIRISGIVLGAAIGVWLLLHAVHLLVHRPLWDVLNLLAVPLTVGAAVPLLNWLQKKRELAVENQRAQDEALQAYLDQMSQLLADKKHPLHTVQPGDSLSTVLSTVARTRTLTVLPRLDRDHKRSVAQFLYESGLIKKTLVFELSGANLSGADLGEARLISATLSSATLSGANLSGANLRGAKLDRADLSRADLTGADLSEADLRYANLSNTSLTQDQLDQAMSLEGATMRDEQILKSDDNPDGPTFEEWLKSKDRGEDGDSRGRTWKIPIWGKRT